MMTKPLTLAEIEAKITPLWKELADVKPGTPRYFEKKYHLMYSLMSVYREATHRHEAMFKEALKLVNGCNMCPLVTGTGSEIDCSGEGQGCNKDLMDYYDQKVMEGLK